MLNVGSGTKWVSGWFGFRSRSLLKSRRISGRLYEIRVHPIQSLHSGSSQSAGKKNIKRRVLKRQMSVELSGEKLPLVVFLKCDIVT